MTVRLPVLGSSAAQTAFVSDGITGPDGVVLWVDGNQKITASNGTYDAPEPNAFSLVQIEDCPGSTPTCRASCFVHGLEAAAKTIHDLYRHNSRTIREIIASPRAMEWVEIVADWVTEHARGGFRWHVSGDLFAPEYAAWIAAVVARSPDVRHWIYTRSFYMTAVFVGLDNITVNYSVDRDNYRDALPYYEAHRAAGSPVRLCYLVADDGAFPVDLPDDSVLFPDYALRGSHGAWFAGLERRHKKMACPVDLHGKSERRRCGPCSRCIDKPAGAPVSA